MNNYSDLALLRRTRVQKCTKNGYSDKSPATRRGRIDLLRFLAVSAGAVCLSSCVASRTPLLTDAKPIEGKQFTAQLYRHFSDGKALEIRTAKFEWKNGTYVNDGGALEVSHFVSASLGGADWIIQGSNAGKQLYLYWIGRKLTNGAYLIFPLDEANVGAAEREALCGKEPPKDFCTVKTVEQLFILARATASRPVKNAEIAIVVEKRLFTPASNPR